MANPLGDSPAASANPLGDSAVAGNPLGDQPAQSNPIGDSPSTQAEPTPGISPLGQMIEQAKQNPNSGDWGQIAKFALLHPISFASGVQAATEIAANDVSANNNEKLKKSIAEAGQPNIHLPRMDETQPGIGGVTAGVLNAGEQAVESLTAPANEPVVVGGAALAPLAAVSTAGAFVMRSLAAYFTASMLNTARKQAGQAGEMIGEKIANPESPTTGGQIAEAVTTPVLSAGMGVAAGKVALTPGVAPIRNALPITESTADALGYLDLNRTNAVQQWIGSDNPREALVFAKDAVTSATERAANTAANDVQHDLTNNFSKGDLPMARRALIPAVESGLDPTALAEMKDRLDTANFRSPAQAKVAKQYSESIDFALEHADDFQDAVAKHEAITSAIYQHAQDSGIEFPYRQNYVLHAQDFEMPEGFEDAQSGAGQGGSFRKMREHDTYADSIAANIKPKSLDGVDLLRTAVRAMQGMVNRNLWTDALQGMKDPTNGESVMVPRTATTRPDGTSYLDTPPGYTPTEVGGRPMAIQNGYAGLFDAMTDPSRVNQTLSKINATGKSITLAIDTYHLGRLAAYQAFSELSRGEAPIPTYKEGLMLGDTPMSAIEDMAAKGEIPADALPTIRENKAIIDLVVNTGLNVGHIADSMHQEWVQKTPVLGQVNKFIFQQFQRGAIYDVAVKEFRYQQAERPDLTNEQIARQVATNVNTRLGNLGSQGIFKSRTAQDIARFGVLAPQWNEALIRSEVGGVKELMQAIPQALQTNRFTPGLLGRTAGTLFAGMFAANQAINLMTRGKPTWENQEEGLGSKLSAWVPDFIGKGPGFFLNPTTLPFEVSHLLMKAYGRTEDWRDAVDQYFRGRLSVLARPIADIAMKHDSMGRPLTTAGTVLDTIPSPIAGGAAYHAGVQLATGTPSETFPGQFQKQAMSTFGLRSDQAPSQVQRIQALAGQFKRDKGIEQNAEYYSGDYQPLAQALRVSNMSEANDSLTDLLERKTPQAVQKHFQESWHYPFTGSKEQEVSFYRTLSPEQQGVYRQAVQDRRQLSMQAEQLLHAHLAGKQAALSSQ